MWYAVYALVQATLALTLQALPLGRRNNPVSRFYWQAIIQVAAFLPIGLLWVFSLLFVNPLVLRMIETAFSLSLLAPFIAHWVGLGMLTIDLRWTDWIQIVLYAGYFVYGVGEILLAMMFSPSIYEYLDEVKAGGNKHHESSEMAGEEADYEKNEGSSEEEELDGNSIF